MSLGRVLEFYLVWQARRKRSPIYMGSNCMLHVYAADVVVPRTFTAELAGFMASVALADVLPPPTPHMDCRDAQLVSGVSCTVSNPCCDFPLTHERLQKWYPTLSYDYCGRGPYIALTSYAANIATVRGHDYAGNMKYESDVCEELDSMDYLTMAAVASAVAVESIAEAQLPSREYLRSSTSVLEAAGDLLADGVCDRLFPCTVSALVHVFKERNGQGAVDDAISGWSAWLPARYPNTSQPVPPTANALCSSIETDEPPSGHTSHVSGWRLGGCRVNVQKSSFTRAW